ncbi:Hypothetical predicted protein [Pelobates cultripes]|uniref:Uncharacterized protein n=1 Tax=Pelobates cultripes TaxID=61616 RepID=A0AAD1RC84_PELCU|nr:Hypothetical predicted protein [Pelobates cultripes]
MIIVVEEVKNELALVKESCNKVEAENTTTLADPTSTQHIIKLQNEIMRYRNDLIRFKKQKREQVNTTGSEVKTFAQVNRYDTEHILKQHTLKGDNLTKKERASLKDLKEDISITIRPADKGGALVIQDYSDYTMEILEQLSDINTYQWITYNPTSAISEKLKALIKRSLESGWLDEHTATFLINENPKIPILYTLPKVHKDPAKLLGRLIVWA